MIKLYYYKLNEHLLFSFLEFPEFEKCKEDDIVDSTEIVFFLNKLDPKVSRRGFAIIDSSQLFQKSEDLNILKKNNTYYNLPPWVDEKISRKKIKSINVNFPSWKDELISKPKNWRVNVFALGDVGSTLLIGLRLLGRNINIGIYDRTPEKIKRWEYELNQIRIPFNEDILPPVKALQESELFDCDMFVFCASKSIAPVGKENVDIRMIQFKDNRNIIAHYGKLARDADFKGIFAVVSDPVDLLCKALYLDSNLDKNGKLDYNGLAPNQIIGYGLGVMNARACFYSERLDGFSHYIKEGSVFGPHGKGLIVADSIKNYNDEKSLLLTKKTLNANLEIRGFGYKPFVAPSLSSGALSILATISGDYFYGSSLMGEVYMGSKMKLGDSGIEVPKYNFNLKLEKRLIETYNELRRHI